MKFPVEHAGRSAGEQTPSPSSEEITGETAKEPVLNNFPTSKDLLPPLGGEGRGGGRIVELTCHSPPSLTLPAEGREQERATPIPHLADASIV